MRVIVTGSRDWDKPGTVWLALQAAYWEAWRHGERLDVARGDCPTGADVHAGLWVAAARRAGLDVAEHVYRADWSIGPAGGPRRNKAMVADGGDKVLAFHKDNSKGTASTIRFAHQAGIHVDIYA
ncbi:hypothetical protein [Nonomuraea sp. CA-141351]|uniref:hypothetical protein n=1 Tax=Nonomuraea sp. CA-141351 TaxID=3239996 RepID=UPI003D8C11F0